MGSTNAVKFVCGGATFFLCYLLLLMPVTTVLSGSTFFVSLPVFALRLEAPNVRVQ
jgi:membrane-anchored glycerophosphoryl diester phosphodiesterase (GDPDase)